MIRHSLSNKCPSINGGLFLFLNLICGVLNLPVKKTPKPKLPQVTPSYPKSYPTERLINKGLYIYWGKKPPFHHLLFFITIFCCFCYFLVQGWKITQVTPNGFKANSHAALRGVSHGVSGVGGVSGGVPQMRLSGNQVFLSTILFCWYNYYIS